MLVHLNSGYAYDDLGLGRKVFYKMIPIPFLELPKSLQDRIKKIEDEENRIKKIEDEEN